TTYSKALQINNKFGPAYRGRGHAYMELNKVDAAIADFTNGIQCNDGAGFICRRERAELNLALKNWAAAKNDYDPLITEYPRSYSFRIGRAHCYLGLNKPELAVPECELAVRNKGDVNHVIRERAKAYIAAHQYKN